MRQATTAPPRRAPAKPPEKQETDLARPKPRSRDAPQTPTDDKDCTVVRSWTVKVPRIPAAAQEALREKLREKLQAGRPDYLAFAETLRTAMQEKGLNASDVARKVWGEIKDSRGYLVARNRDRIGYYLAGVSFPEDENLRKLADAVGLSYEKLAMTKPPSGPAGASVGLEGSAYAARRGTLNTQLDIPNNRPGYATLTLKREMRLDTALKIIAMLKADDDADAQTAGGSNQGQTPNEPPADAK